jgi:hypothetical protein
MFTNRTVCFDLRGGAIELTVCIPIFDLYQVVIKRK